jgi:hypothetical protein
VAVVFAFTAGTALGNTTVVLAGLSAFVLVACGGKLFSILTVTEFETPAGYVVGDEVAPEDEAAGMEG